MNHLRVSKPSLHHCFTMHTRRSTRITRSTRVVETEGTIVGALGDAPRPAKRVKTTAAKGAIQSDGAGLVIETTASVASTSKEVKALKKSKTKAKQEEPKPEDFPARVESPWKIGVHVSAAGGVENAIVNAAKLG